MTTMSSSKTLRLGMIGCGTVGTGVYNILQKKLAGVVQITKICVAHRDKPRPDLLLNARETTFVSTVDEIFNDHEIHGVVELMGGTTEARDIVFRALGKSLHVITANKALMAVHFQDLMSLLNQQPETTFFGYEAAVCGGIPIINTLQQCYGVHDDVQSITGILNGTTNFMLSKMEHDPTLEYGQVLAEAQALGFAESDPSADVDGLDVRAKLLLLAALAFGPAQVPKVEDIPTTGIRDITPMDFDYAKKMGCTLKLVGVAAKVVSDTEGGTISPETVVMYVSPALIPQSNVMASISGATNLVSVHSTRLGQASYIGEGAGRYPTANSVVSDIVRLVHAHQTQSSVPAFPASASLASNETCLRFEQNYSARFYIRLTVCDQVGIVKVVGDLAERAQVSIHALLQSERSTIERRTPVNFVITTDRTQRSQVDQLCQALGHQAFARGTPLVFPILDA